MFKSVGLVASFDKQNSIKIAKKLVEYLKEKGIQVVVEEKLANKMQDKVQTTSLRNMTTDLIITIGGDGTILQTGVTIPKTNPTILAINMGVRGFLTEVDPVCVIDAIEKCLKGDYQVEKCIKISTKIDGKKIPDALNEVLITTHEPAKVLYTQILKNNVPILNCQADGLIVATQTGSTGYSLSAGGPVLDPKVKAFVLTPICPLNFFHPIVFPATSEITIKVNKPKDAVVVIDGHYHMAIESKSDLKLSRSPNQTFFIRFEKNFYSRLRNRLLFKGTK